MYLLHPTFLPEEIPDRFRGGGEGGIGLSFCPEVKLRDGVALDPMTRVADVLTLPIGERDLDAVQLSERERITALGGADGDLLAVVVSLVGDLEPGDGDLVGVFFSVCGHVFFVCLFPRACARKDL